MNGETHRASRATESSRFQIKSIVSGIYVYSALAGVSYDIRISGVAKVRVVGSNLIARSRFS